MRYPRNQGQQPAYYKSGGGIKATAVVLGILCGLLFIGLLVSVFQVMEKNNEITTKTNTINNLNIDLADANRKLSLKKEALLDTTGESDPATSGSAQYWKQKYELAAADLIVEIQQSEHYRKLIPLGELHKNEDVYISKMDLQKGADMMYLTLQLMNKTNINLNGVRGKVRFIGNNQIVLEKSFTVPELKAGCETTFKLEPMKKISHDFFNAELVAGHNPYKKNN